MRWGATVVLATAVAGCGVADYPRAVEYRQGNLSARLNQVEGLPPTAIVLSVARDGDCLTVRDHVLRRETTWYVAEDDPAPCRLDFQYHQLTAVGGVLAVDDAKLALPDGATAELRKDGTLTLAAAP